MRKRLLLGWIFIMLFCSYSFAQEEKLSGTVEDGIRVVKVRAFRYGFSPDPIIVKKGEKVRFETTSSDIKHGLAIKEFKVNVVIPANEISTVEFTADKTGIFTVKCSVFCGFGHGKMKGILKVVE